VRAVLCVCSSSEVKAILHYLDDSDIDKDSGVEILQVLFNMLASINAPKRLSTSTVDKSTSIAAESILDHLIAFGGVIRLIGMLKRENLQCRVWVLKVVAKMLQLCAPTPRRRDSLLRGEFLLGDTSTMGSFWSVLKIAKQHLQVFAFSEPIYHTLLEVLLELPSACTTNPLENLDEPLIRNAATLAMIFELLCTPGMSPCVWYACVRVFADPLVQCG
jgi:hypothetical protein